MIENTIFDVLIVYSGKIASSVASFNQTKKPFRKGSANESYNLVYSYFLETCTKQRIKAAFATSTDIIGPGLVKCFWLYKNKRWLKKRTPGFSKLIFDKFSPTGRKDKSRRRLLFSSDKVKPFNNQSIFDLCFDKQKTYAKLRKFTIPTVTITDATVTGVNKACNKLSALVTDKPCQSDFSDEVVIKDRFGAGGRNVYKFQIGQSAKMVSTLQKHKKVHFIIQPFVKFDKGYTYHNSPVSADIRLIFFGKKLIQTYLRIAKVGDFRCNEHRGGLLKYISSSSVPSEVRDLSATIVKVLNNKSSLYALDFIISNSGHIYLLEANTGPGLDWNLSLKENEIEAKKLIRFIVKVLVKRARTKLRSQREKTPQIPVNIQSIAYPQILLAPTSGL